MIMAYVHLLSHHVGNTVVTVCGLKGVRMVVTNRYQGASCGKCRRDSGKGK